MGMRILTSAYPDEWPPRRSVQPVQVLAAHPWDLPGYPMGYFSNRANEEVSRELLPFTLCPDCDAPCDPGDHKRGICFWCGASLEKVAQQ